MRARLLLAFTVLLSPAALAQIADQSGPQNPAVKSPSANNSMNPVSGANSFTRSEAISRIESRGYTHVRHVKKDANGVWHAVAKKDGHSGPVTVDYQGNVN